jgi:hypothetical protein
MNARDSGNDAPPHRSPVAGRRTTRPKMRRPWLAVWGCLIVTAAVAATVGMLRAYPPRSETTVVSRAHAKPLPHVAILATEANRSFLRSTGGDYDRAIEAWRATLWRAGAEIEVVSDAAAWLRAAQAGEHPVLAAPHLICASAGTIDTLLLGVAAGGGLLLAGATGVRDEAGRWIGWDRLGGKLGLPDLTAGGNLPPVSSLERGRGRILMIGSESEGDPVSAARIPLLRRAVGYCAGTAPPPIGP